jgi:hypothetical protein
LLKRLKVGPLIHIHVVLTKGLSGNAKKIIYGLQLFTLEQLVVIALIVKELKFGKDLMI